jgi:hypothetical protein
MAVREDPEDGRPAPAARGAPVPPSTRDELHLLVRDMFDTMARRQRRRAGGAADRRRPAAGDLRHRPQPALPRRAAGAAHGAAQPGDHAAVGRRWRTAGKAACRCPACAAWCRASRASATPASTRRASRSTARGRWLPCPRGAARVRPPDRPPVPDAGARLHPVWLHRGAVPRPGRRLSSGRSVHPRRDGKALDAARHPAAAGLGQGARLLDGVASSASTMLISSR